MFLIFWEVAVHVCVVMSSQKTDNAIVARQFGLQICLKLCSSYGGCRSHTFDPGQLRCTLEIMTVESRLFHDVNLISEVCATNTRYSRTIQSRLQRLKNVTQTLKVSTYKKANKNGVTRNRKANQSGADGNTKADKRCATKNKKADKKCAAKTRKADKRGAARNKKADKRSVARNKKADKRGAARNKKADKRSVARNKKADKRSVTRNKNADKRGAAKNKKADKRGEARNKKADKRGVARNKKADKRSVAKNKKADERGAAKNKKADKRSVARNKKADKTGAAKNKKADERSVARNKKAIKRRVARNKKANKKDEEVPQKRRPANKLWMRPFFKTWNKSQADCQHRGGTLVMPKTKEDVDDLANTIPDLFIPGKRPFWFGLSDVYRNNTFFWIDGRPCVHSSIIFRKPISFGKRKAGCGQFTVDWSKRLTNWRSAPCGSECWSICQE